MNMGILEKVDTADWAAPIVPVTKPSGEIRLCGDYEVSINPHLEINQYPLPHPEVLFAALNGGAQFTKLDLSEAYLQILLDEQSKKYLVINTHKGLHCFTRLPYGVASVIIISMIQYSSYAHLHGKPSCTFGSKCAST